MTATSARGARPAHLEVQERLEASRGCHCLKLKAINYRGFSPRRFFEKGVASPLGKASWICIGDMPQGHLRTAKVVVTGLIRITVIVIVIVAYSGVG